MRCSRSASSHPRRRDGPYHGSRYTWSPFTAGGPTIRKYREVDSSDKYMTFFIVKARPIKVGLGAAKGWRRARDKSGTSVATIRNEFLSALLPRRSASRKRYRPRQARPNHGGNLNEIYFDFRGCGTSACDFDCGLVEGRCERLQRQLLQCYRLFVRPFSADLHNGRAWPGRLPRILH